MMGKAAGFNPKTDFTPISNAATLPMLVITAYNSPINTLPELLEQAHIKPRAVSFGSSGIGGPGHLAVGTPKRLPQFPYVPTMSEADLPGFEETAPWVGMLAPADTPPAIINRLNAAMHKALDDPEVKQRLKTLGLTPLGGSANEFKNSIKIDYEKFGNAIKAANLTRQ